MISLHAYLSFNGNCREAMRFYQKCLGGKLQFQTVGDSPIGDIMPAKMKKCILHSRLSNELMVIDATDCVPNNGLIKGNSVSLLIQCDNENHIHELFKKLVDGGEATNPLSTTFRGALFGELTDKFGIHWLLHYQTKK